MEKAIMSLKEVCDYTGWGETKVRQILKNPVNKFTVVLGNWLFVNKKLFDEYLEKCAKYHISIWKNVGMYAIKQWWMKLQL